MQPNFDFAATIRAPGPIEVALENHYLLFCKTLTFLEGHIRQLEPDSCRKVEIWLHVPTSIKTDNDHQYRTRGSRLARLMSRRPASPTPL